MIRDIPASELPEDAVADSINTLLFGDRFKVRPGVSEWSSTLLPVYLALTGVSRPFSTVSADQTFTSEMIGKYIKYDNSTAIDQITSINSGNAVISNIVEGTATSTANIYGDINGHYFHKKSQKLFIHINTDIYYTDYLMTTWTKVLSSIGSLGDSRSTMDEFRDDIFVFNANGHFKIDTSQSPFFMIQINTTPPTNTILPNTNYATDEEDATHPFARRYLYSMSRISGSEEPRSRESGYKIIKETGLNVTDPNDNYLDYKEIWGYRNPGDDVQETMNIRYLQTFQVDLQDWVGVILNWDQTIIEYDNGTTTNHVKNIQADCTEANNWSDVADAITLALRKAFPLFKYLKCFYDSDRIYLYSCQANLSIGDIVAPSYINGVDATAQNGVHWFYNGADATVEVGTDGWNFIGNSATDSLQIPSNQDGWTHFSVYTTKYFNTSEEKFRAINNQKFIWNHDIRVVAGFRGTIDSTGLITLSSGNFEKCDSGCRIYLEDGTVGFLKNIITTTTANSDIRGDGSTTYSFFIGASEIKYASVSNNILTLQSYYNQTQPVSTADLDIDPDDGFTLKIANGDLVEVNDGISLTYTSIKQIARGRQNPDNFVGIEDSFATFITDNIQAGFFVTNLRTGTTTTIVSVDSETELTLTDNFNFENRDMYVIYNDTINTSGNLWGFDLDGVTIPAGDSYKIFKGSKFVEADVGKTIHWAGGLTSIITEYINEYQVYVDTIGKSAEYMIIDPVGRSFSDVIDDELLSNRELDWPAIARFWTGLPNGELGNIAPGFINVAPRLSDKSYYSQLNFDVVYLAGHYRADFQFLEFKGRLTSIKDTPNQIIYFCANSTWRTLTNTVNTIEDERIGEIIAIQSGPALIDGHIGAVDNNSIVDVGIGEYMLITSDPGIRSFDGYRYSDNLVIDEEGRGLILKDLQQMRSRFIAIYEPNLYGFLFWGNTDSIDIAQISNTNVCYRLALRAEQGFGFSQLQGDDFPFPNLGGGPITLTDDNEENFTIVIDYKEMKPYLLSTRKHSTISNRNPYYLDKSAEIEWSLLFREHTSNDESKKLRFLEQKFMMRPEEESNKGASGYDDNGFRDALTVKIEAFKDGNLTADSEVNANRSQSVVFTGVNQLGTLKPNLAYPYKTEAQRLQHKISGVGSEIQCVKYLVIYDEIDVALPPHLVSSERNFQRELATPVFWISRGLNKLLNIANGKSASGTIQGFLGPDGNAESAIYLENGTEYSWTDVTVSELMKIIFHIYTDDGTNFEYKETVTGEIFTNLYRIVITNNLEIYHKDVLLTTIAFSADPKYVSITKNSSDELIVKTYDNSGTEESSTTVSSVSGSSSYSATITISAEEIILFDFRRYNQPIGIISEDAVKYLIRDVYDYSGFSLLPEYGV